MQLPEPIEFTTKHDPYINRKFIDLMGQPEMVEGDFTPELPDFQRAMAVGLPANDPARPSPPAIKPKYDEVADPYDVMNGTDEEGDSIHVAYNAERRLIFIRTSPKGYYMPIGKVPGLIGWLQSRMAKDRKGRAS